MQFIALLRGVTPTGRNRIPSMAFLAEILTDAGYRNVRTYIQSGNIIFETDLSRAEAEMNIHDVIFNRIGADLSVILKTRKQLMVAVEENPFGEGYDLSGVHLTFTNDPVEDDTKVKSIEETDFGGDQFLRGRQCFYLYLPQGVRNRTLYSGYLEKKLGIKSTTRKLSVVSRLCELADHAEKERE